MTLTDSFIESKLFFFFYKVGGITFVGLAFKWKIWNDDVILFLCPNFVWTDAQKLDTHSDVVFCFVFHIS